MTRLSRKSPSPITLSEAAPDAAILQATINRRLAIRLGVSLPVAAAVAALAGIGPQSREAR